MESTWRSRVQLTVLSVVVGLSACHAARSTRASTTHLLPNTALAVDSGIVVVNGIRLFYEAAGSGSVVVLIHGSYMDRRMWDPQFLAFAREHRVIRYDIRGFGRSDAAVVPFQAHEDLFALLQTLNVTHASLVGLSGGGRIAIDFTLAHPSMVDRLVLAAPGLSGWRYDLADTLWKPAARLARSRGDSVGMVLALLTSDNIRPAMEHPDLAPRIRELAVANMANWMGLIRHGDPEIVASPPALHHTGMLRVPTLLVIGTRDNADLLNIADTLSATVPHLRRVTFEGAGHVVNMEQPARFTELVLAFLRAVRPNPL